MQAQQPTQARANGIARTAAPIESPDFYEIDDLLQPEHKLVRASIRDFVSREIKPIIDEQAQKAEFPMGIVQKFAQIGAFGSTIPTEYGGGGLDAISYGLMMQEIERGDSGMRSVVSVQSSANFQAS